MIDFFKSLLFMGFVFLVQCSLHAQVVDEDTAQHSLGGTGNRNDRQYMEAFGSPDTDYSNLRVLQMDKTTGTTGTDDGVLDSTPWAALDDTAVTSDGDVKDVFYSVFAVSALTASGAASGGVSRIRSGFNTNHVSGWTIHDFAGENLPDRAGNPDVREVLKTPGSVNWMPCGLLSGAGASSYENLRGDQWNK
ncbi:MAG: hypothetical protein CR997_11330 [Acidobacteria bacterium]|nr:MAG: hypothetical protein CR997_11330 [Acidobacteriota bacterium]